MEQINLLPWRQRQLRCAQIRWSLQVVLVLLIVILLLTVVYRGLKTQRNQWKALHAQFYPAAAPGMDNPQSSREALVDSPPSMLQPQVEQDFFLWLAGVVPSGEIALEKIASDGVNLVLQGRAINEASLHHWVDTLLIGPFLQSLNRVRVYEMDTETHVITFEVTGRRSGMNG